MSACVTTRLSKGGHVALPRAIRDMHGWVAGTALTVENMADGVLIKAATAIMPTSPFPPTRFEDVRGMLRDYVKTPLTLEDMDRAIGDAVQRRQARGRY